MVKLQSIASAKMSTFELPFNVVESKKYSRTKCKDYGSIMQLYNAVTCSVLI